MFRKTKAKLKGRIIILKMEICNWLIRVYIKMYRAGNKDDERRMDLYTRRIKKYDREFIRLFGKFVDEVMPVILND